MAFTPLLAARTTPIRAPVRTTTTLRPPSALPVPARSARPTGTLRVQQTGIQTRRGPAGGARTSPTFTATGSATQGAPGTASTSGATQASGAAGTSPLDATYYGNVAMHTFDTNRQIDALNLANTQAGTAYQAALGQLNYQQPRDLLRLEAAANARGGLYSSGYDQSAADLGTQYGNRNIAATNDYNNTLDRNNANIASLQQGVGVYNLAQALASAERASQAAANNPAIGQTAPVSQTPTVPTTPTVNTALIPSGRQLARIVAQQRAARSRLTPAQTRAVGRALQSRQRAPNRL